MVFTNKGCWHFCIENYSVADYRNTNNDSDSKNACPFCINRCSKFILPVHKKGTIKMLADLFIADCAGEMMCIDMVNKIETYKEVGTLVYGR